MNITVIKYKHKSTIGYNKHFGVITKRSDYIEADQSKKKAIKLLQACHINNHQQTTIPTMHRSAYVERGVMRVQQHNLIIQTLVLLIIKNKQHFLIVYCLIVSKYMWLKQGTPELEVVWIPYIFEGVLENLILKLKLDINL